MDNIGYGEHRIECSKTDKTFSLLVKSGNCELGSAISNTLDGQVRNNDSNSDERNTDMNLLESENNVNTTGISLTTRDNINQSGNDALEPAKDLFLTNSKQTEVIIHETNYS